MDNIYWWYENRQWEFKFEFFNKEWTIPEWFLETSHIVNDAREVQELVDNFYSKYAPKNSSMDSLN